MILAENAAKIDIVQKGYLYLQFRKSYLVEAFSHFHGECCTKAIAQTMVNKQVEEKGFIHILHCTQSQSFYFT